MRSLWAIRRPRAIGVAQNARHDSAIGLGQARAFCKTLRCREIQAAERARHASAHVISGSAVSGVRSTAPHGRDLGELLGHADVTTTLRIYSHVLPTMQAAAADAMDRLFAQGARQ